MKKKKKKIPDLDKYVILSLSVIIIYTIISIIYQFVTGQELSGVLTTCLFALFGGELFSLAMIKKLKLKNEKKKEEQDGEIDE